MSKKGRYEIGGESKFTWLFNGAYIASFRKFERNMTRAELANATGLPVHKITAIEKGKIGMSRDECLKIIAALHCEARDILEYNSRIALVGIGIGADNETR